LRIHEHYWAENKDKKLTFYLRTIKELKVNNVKDITGDLHSSFTDNYNKRIFLIDKDHIYILDVETGTIKKFLEQQITFVHFLDNRYLYTLLNKGTKTSRSGFYVYDINNLVENDNDTKYYLDTALVGINNILDYSADN
jgi:hypothetical protein